MSSFILHKAKSLSAITNKTPKSTPTTPIPIPSQPTPTNEPIPFLPTNDLKFQQTIESLLEYIEIALQEFNIRQAYYWKNSTNTNDPVYFD